MYFENRQTVPLSRSVRKRITKMRCKLIKKILKLQGTSFKPVSSYALRSNDNQFRMRRISIPLVLNLWTRQNQTMEKNLSRRCHQ